VYYGPGLSGKTTNLQYVHTKVPGNTRGKLISLATEADRTLYFDFLPLNIGTINGLTAKFQLYTVPGQVYYNATRKLVLRGVDGVVFVADSQPDKMDDNLESLSNLEENLAEYGYDMNTLPMVIQYNKRDLPGVLPVEELNKRLNKRNLPHFEASATIGNGVFDTLKLVIKLVLEKAKSAGAGKHKAPAAVAAQPAPQPTPAPESAAPRAPQQSVPPERPVEPTPAAPAEAAPAVSAAPEPQPAIRPYPGSDTQPVATTAVQDPPRPSMAPSSPDQEAPRKPHMQPSKSTSPVQSRPSADARPKAEREATGKKRGFIKRLFGIK
jgi:signal recognition particle receptor subunit beta